MKRYLPFLIVFAVALITVASGAMLYRANRPAILTISAEQSASGSLHVRGNPSAPVTLEEFADFQCPLCGKLAAAISEFEHDFHPRLRVIFHHLPLDNMHKHARIAAFAAEAAALQGRFWEMHDMLYREQAVWSKSSFVPLLFNSYAEKIGLDLDRFKKDMESDIVKARVETDQRRAASLGVTRTPTIFLNDREVPTDDLTAERLRKAVDAAVNPKPSS